MAICGMCHEWGVNPQFKDDKCNWCHRHKKEIKKAHGKIFLSEDELGKEIKKFHLLYKCECGSIKFYLTLDHNRCVRCGRSYRIFNKSLDKISKKD